MNILGLNFGHDSSACIIKNGRLVSAIATERITRLKKDFYITKEVIDYVLESSELNENDIDVIAISDYYDNSHYDKVIKIYDNNDMQIDSIQANSHSILGNDYRIFNCEFRNRIIPIYILPHHLCHMASAFYTSNFEESWCFSMDSCFKEPKYNSAIAKGVGNKLFFEYSPGLMTGVAYSLLTEAIGFVPSYARAGTTMGMASYGSKNTDFIENIDKYIKDSYFDMEEEPTKYINYYHNLFNNLINSDNKNDLLKRSESNDFYKRANLSANIQYLFEMSILKTINNIKNQNIKNICLSGGSMLNCNANTLIKTCSKFENTHHFPACGDDGISVGAGLYVAHHIFNNPRQKYSDSEICYLGKDYKYIEPDYKYIAQLLNDDKIVAWFMGKSEFGPRALGHRSILANPKNYHNKEILNSVIKEREWFRPFAPMILEEECHKWFDLKHKSPFMLYTYNVLNKNEVPAITHIDGTARIQTINNDFNQPCYKLLKEFEKISGIPMLLNTSLNTKGMPIIETEQEAINLFNSTSIDVLVLNGNIYTK